MCLHAPMLGAFGFRSVPGFFRDNVASGEVAATWPYQRLHGSTNPGLEIAPSRSYLCTLGPKVGNTLYPGLFDLYLAVSGACRRVLGSPKQRAAVVSPWVMEL